MLLPKVLAAAIVLMVMVGSQQVYLATSHPLHICQALESTVVHQRMSGGLVGGGLQDKRLNTASQCG